VLGTLANVGAIIAGSLTGLMFRGGIPEKYNKTVMQAISLAVILIGLKSAFKGDQLLMVIISLALGSICGELLKIETGLEKFGLFLERKLSGKGGNVAQGFVTSTLMFCVGSMAIVGALESGLTGNHDTLFAKSALDGIVSVILTSTLGFGVLVSAIPVLIYQGAITLAASFIKPFLIPEVITQMTSVGGLLIVALGINMLLQKKIHVGNMLPSIFIPLIYYAIKTLFV